MSLLFVPEEELVLFVVDVDWVVVVGVVVVVVGVVVVGIVVVVGVVADKVKTKWE